MIIAFVQTKGGTGKSTLALNMAFSKKMRREFSNIAIVELDPQGTLKKWWERRAKNNLKSKGICFTHISSDDKSELLEKIVSLEDENDLLLLDVPGESISKFHTQFACAMADIVLIPMRTSTNDEEAFEDNLLPIIKKIIEIDEDGKNVFHVIPSFTHPLANKESIIGYFNDIIPDYIQCLDAIFSFGTVFENFSRGGNTIYDYALSVKSNNKLYKQSIKAIKDMEKIADEIIKIRE